MNSIVDKVREQNPHDPNQSPNSNLAWHQCCDAFAQQLQSSPSAGVWDLGKVAEISKKFLSHFFSGDITTDEAWDIWIGTPQGQEFLKDVKGFYSWEQTIAKLQNDFGLGPVGEDWEVLNAQEHQSSEQLWQEVCELVYKEYNKGREPYKALQKHFAITLKPSTNG